MKNYQGFDRKSGNERSAWFLSIRRNTNRSGRRTARSQRQCAAQRKRCARVCPAERDQELRERLVQFGTRAAEGIGAGEPAVRMSCGGISPPSRPGSALSTRPASWTGLPAGSWTCGGKVDDHRSRPGYPGQARWARSGAGEVAHHSDRGRQYRSIRYSECLAEAGAVPSVGSVGDSYDNTLTEPLIGLYKAEVIHRRRIWRSLDAVESATLEWVDWFNHRRLLDPIGYLPPAEQESLDLTTVPKAGYVGAAPIRTCFDPVLSKRFQRSA